MSEKEQQKKQVKRCVEMFTDEVSIVTGGANGHRQWLMIKSDGIGQIVEDTEKAVPDKDAPRETKEKAQASRSKQYGIEVLSANSNLSFPAGAPSTERLYGDPVNLKYPLAYAGATSPDPARTRNAIVRFKQNPEAYSERSSRARVYERIVRSALSAGINVSYDPNDPIDQLLPGDLKTRLQKNADGPNTEPSSTEEETAETAAEPSVGDWLDGVEKSIDQTAYEDWFAGIQSAIDSVDGSQDADRVKKGASDVEVAAELEVSRQPSVELDESKQALDDLKKESTAKDAQIGSLEKSITTLKAEVARLSTSIGPTRALIPGDADNSAQTTPVDDRHSAFDLGPALSD